MDFVCFFTLLTGDIGTIVPTHFSGLKRMQKHFNIVFFEVWDSVWGECKVWRVLGSVLGCGGGEGRCGEVLGEVKGGVGKCVGVWGR